MENRTWIMNCVLCGARVAQLLREGKEDKARQVLSELTSEFEPQDVSYLLFRLKGLPREEELPSPSEIRGIDPDFTGELTTEEYIRRLRE